MTTTEGASPEAGGRPAAAGKGLKRGAMGLLGCTSMGLASTAPMYTMAASVGLVIVLVGVHSVSAMVLAFIPMYLQAVANRELNRVIPDCGTTFTWATKAIGPYVGWMGGWAMSIAGIVVLGNMGQVAGQYTFAAIGANDLRNNQWAVAALGVAFVLLVTYISYRGISFAAWLQTALVIVQYAAIVLLAFLMLRAVYSGDGPASSLKPEWSWLSPTGDGITWSQFLTASMICLFVYWGWDATSSMNEETKNPTKTPGRAAVLATVILLGGFTVMTLSTVSYAGAGDNGLINHDNADSIFDVVVEPLIGKWGLTVVLIITVFSAASSAQTTILPTARGTLSMATYKALPARFTSVNPRYQTPGFSTWVTTFIGLIFFLIVTAISEDTFFDILASTSLSIAFYYAVTAFACVAYFQREAFSSPRAFYNLLLCPLLSGVLMTAALIVSAIQMIRPDYTEAGTSFLGIGVVFWYGVGSLALGIPLMLLWKWKAPNFFRGITLNRDTPILAPED
jgi:amino acid transporter